MSLQRRLIWGLAAASSLSTLAGAALADPPGRVGRVSEVDGYVSFRPVGEDDWATAQRNLPVTTGESFWSDDSARFELQIAGVEARVGSQSELDVLNLDYGVTRLALPQGSVDLHVWRVPRGGVVIATPAGEVHIDQPGLYRVDAQAADGDGDYGPLVVTVFEGEAMAPGPDGFTPVEAGQSATLLPGYDIDWEYAQATPIDAWARDRDASEQAWRQSDDLWGDYTGAAELEGQGDWSDQGGFGRVWFPRDVGADWAPYRFGHWGYVQPWGWTWIDDQSWGFAPFHYGRWAQFGGRWGWVPGQPAAEPVYAPALVAFIGGAGWGVSVGGGGEAMGWVPLGPDEVYRPPYQASDGYFRRANTGSVNITIINQVNINAPTVVVYRNVQAATVVPQAAFAHGGSVQTSVVRVSAADLARAPAGAHVDRIAPTRAAVTGSAAPRPGATAGAAPALPPHPPAKLQALRTAVAAQAPGSSRPPATLKPATPPPATPGAKPLVKHDPTKPPAPRPTFGPAPGAAATGTLEGRRPPAPTASNPPLQPAVKPAAPRPMDRVAPTEPAIRPAPVRPDVAPPAPPPPRHEQTEVRPAPKPEAAPVPAPAPKPAVKPAPKPKSGEAPPKKPDDRKDEPKA